MTDYNYRENLDKIYTSLSFERRELILKLEELNNLKRDFHQKPDNNLTAKDFRKVESEIDLIREKINLLEIDRKKLKNQMKMSNIIKDVEEKE